jgi:hypothetical protein
MHLRQSAMRRYPFWDRQFCKRLHGLWISAPQSGGPSVFQGWLPIQISSPAAMSATAKKNSAHRSYHRCGLTSTLRLMLSAWHMP